MMNKSIKLNIHSNINWLHLPDCVILTLSQYLKQNDLIELSKICKIYRNYLRSRVLRALIIPYNLNRIYKIDLFNSSNHAKAIVNCLKQDFKGKYQLVKGVVILDACFSNQLVGYFLELFPLISYITIISSNYKRLFEVLSSSKYLQHITLYSNFSNFKPEELNFNSRLFRQFKTIKLRTPSHIINYHSPFDLIDSSYSNLNCLTIISNVMLNNLTSGFPSLKVIELQGYSFDNSEISKLISNNPQLKKLSISTGHLNESVINSILGLERLNKLYINDSSWSSENELNIYNENYSIKHLKYTGNDYNTNIIKFINMCLSLKVFEICDIAVLSSFVTIANEEFAEIDTLLIACSFDVHSVRLLLKLKKFKQIKFRSDFNFNEVYSEYKHLHGKNWVPKQDYPANATEFTLTRI